MLFGEGGRISARPSLHGFRFFCFRLAGGLVSAVDLLLNRLLAAGGLLGVVGEGL
jgi:hypothetical protein